VLATEQLDGSGFQQGSAGLEYSLSRSGGELRAGFDGSASHYPTLSRSTLPVYRAAVDGSAQLWSDARLRGSYEMISGPFYQLAWSSEEYGGQPTGPLPYSGQGLSAFEDHTRHSALVAFQQSLSRRLSVSGGYELYRNQSAVISNQLVGDTARANVSYMFARGLSAQAGYIMSTYRFGSADTGTYRVGHFDGGLVFNRGLSFARGQLNVSFNTGLSALQSDTQTHYLVTGNASLSRDFGRTWQGRLTYDRVHVRRIL
jgi:hypothetical protein